SLSWLRRVEAICHKGAGRPDADDPLWRPSRMPGIWAPSIVFPGTSLALSDRRKFPTWVKRRRLMDKSTSCIMVATDFSDCSDRALRQGVRLAERLGARLDLVHVHDVQVAALPELMLAVPQNDVDVLRRLRDELRALRDREVAGRVPCQIHLRIGDPVGG